METIASVARTARLRTRPWTDYEFRQTVPEYIFDVPGMLWTQEKRMLYYLARHEYKGAGVVADMGAYLGGSTVCLAAGLRDQGIEGPTIHSFDLFKVGEFGAELEQFPGTPPADNRTRAVFEDNLHDYLDLVVVHEGDILAESWNGTPIEVMFIDIAKSYKVLDHLLLTFFPALIPGQSLVIMQDYLSPQTGPWHHIAMEKLAGYFEYVTDTDVASAIFSLERGLPMDALEQSLYARIPREEKLELIDLAIERLDTSEKKEFLVKNRELLVSGRDEAWGMHYHDR